MNETQVESLSPFACRRLGGRFVRPAGRTVRRAKCPTVRAAARFDISSSAIRRRRRLARAPSGTRPPPAARRPAPSIVSRAVIARVPRNPCHLISVLFLALANRRQPSAGRRQPRALADSAAVRRDARRTSVPMRRAIESQSRPHAFATSVQLRLAQKTIPRARLEWAPQAASRARRPAAGARESSQSIGAGD